MRYFALSVFENRTSRGRRGSEMPILHFLKRRKENAVFGHRSRRENALAHLARGKQHTVLFLERPCSSQTAQGKRRFRSPLARDNALAHLARGKQHTVLFLERPCSTLAERFFGTKKNFANKTRPPVKIDKVVSSQTSQSSDHLAKVRLILLVGDSRVLCEALTRELLASSARPKPLLPHAAGVDWAPLGTRIL